MSTQSTPSILFTHRSPQQGFRLLELPPELADLLSSDNPPTLELKSPVPLATSGTGSTATPGSEYVDLCTPSQTYSIRQVQSSNSLHVLRPSNGFGVRKHDLRIVGGGSQEQGDGEDMDMDEKDLNIDGTVTSIAKCASTLELHTPAEGFSAAPFFASLLRVYDKGVWEDGDGDENAGGMDRAEAIKMVRVAIDRVFGDVPVSRAQCERDWVEMCAFVLLGYAATGENGPSTSTSSCWRPSAEMRLNVWKRVVEGAVLQGIDLGKQFLVEDLWKSVLDDDGLAPFPRPLFEAVVLRICGLADRAERGFAESEMKWTSIDKKTCIRWVGAIYLEATAIGAGSAVGESEFMNAWKDQLPETWRGDVSISVLPRNCYLHPEPKTICFATELDRQKVKKNLPTDASAATAAKKTRNWHELFKNQKRQKR
ncbi:hypothetical protein BDW62DRAFT_41504 [Aspergillus aurantiobrunneus]